MKEDFLRYFRLESAYTINHFIHSLHRLPLIKKLVEGRSYDAKGLKILGSIYRVFKQIIMLLVFKGIYYGVIIAFAALIASERVGEDESLPLDVAGLIFLTIFLFTSLTGALFNNKLFDTNEHSYYAISLLRVDARNYALINYGYFMVKTLIANILAALIAFAVFRVSFVTMLLSAFFVTGVKLTFECLYLFTVDFFHKHTNLELWTKIILTVIYGVAMSALVLSGHELSLTVLNIIFILFIIAGALSTIKIIGFKDYSRVYKKEMSLTRNAVEKNKTANLQKEKKAASDSLSSKTLSATSDKTGFAYLNDLFMKRHHKSLWGVVRIELIVIAVFFVGFSAVLYFVGDEDEELSGLLLKWIPSIMFLMYILNRGQNFTTCLFVNCDHCLLTYPFFKEPKQILKLFTLRLISLIKLNILPGIFLGVGLCSIYYFAGGPSEWLNYFVFFVSPIAMSVFFSIHYMMLYYILQPFTVDAEVASVPYKVINVLTYVVSYTMLQAKIGSAAFGIGTIIFCVIYSVVAMVLVYTKATKTFKIKR